MAGTAVQLCRSSPRKWACSMESSPVPISSVVDAQAKEACSLLPVYHHGNCTVLIRRKDRTQTSSYVAVVKHISPSWE